MVAAALILLVVPEKPGTAAGGNLRHQVGEILKIYRSSYFWRIVPLMFTCASANMAIQGLWAGPWLHDVIGLDRQNVAEVLVVMAGCFSVGVFLSGPFAFLLGRLGLTISGSCCVGAILSTSAIMLVVLRLPLPPYFVWGTVGLFGTLTSLVFAALAQHFPPTHIARANTACNVMVFGAAFIYQSGLGLIIQQWEPLASGAYPPQAYVTAFLCATATQLVAIVWFIWPIGGRYR